MKKHPYGALATRSLGDVLGGVAFRSPPSTLVAHQNAHLPHGGVQNLNKKQKENRQKWKIYLKVKRH